MSLYFKYLKNTLKNLSLSRCSTGWPLKMCKYQGQKRCLQRYWYSFSLPWRCKYFQNTLLTILGVKITIFITKWLFRGVNWIKCVKTVDFDHKKFGNIFWKYLHLHGSEKLYRVELALAEKGGRSLGAKWCRSVTTPLDVAIYL